jgi:hypothetical protein
VKLWLRSVFGASGTPAEWLSTVFSGPSERDAPDARKALCIVHRVALNIGPFWRKRRLQPKQDVLWYKGAIIYQVHVRTFYDNNGDGIGDFPGLEQKLDMSL